MLGLGVEEGDRDGTADDGENDGKLLGLGVDEGDLDGVVVGIWVKTKLGMKVGVEDDGLYVGD